MITVKVVATCVVEHGVSHWIEVDEAKDIEIEAIRIFKEEDEEGEVDWGNEEGFWREPIIERIDVMYPVDVGNGVTAYKIKYTIIPEGEKE